MVVIPQFLAKDLKATKHFKRLSTSDQEGLYGADQGQVLSLSAF